MNNLVKKFTIFMLSQLLVLNLVGCSTSDSTKIQETSVPERGKVEETEKTEESQEVEEAVEEKDSNSFPSLAPDTEATISFAYFKELGIMEILEEFKKFYPNVTIEAEECERPANKSNDYLMTRAASEDLPDVFLGFPSLPLVISQGWAYPLDELVLDDSEFEYVPEDAMNILRLGADETLYALPYQVNMDIITMNMDLLEELNMDVPEYTWTMDEFVELAKGATTSKTSGIQSVWNLETKLVGVLGGENNLGRFGYSAELDEFVLTDGTWTKAAAYTNELRSVKGVVADAMMNDKVRKEGGVDDYQKKFGKDSKPLQEGKILMEILGTWNWSNIKKHPGNWEIYPMPSDPEGRSRQGIHYHYGFMSSTTEEPEVALELLKFFTYSVEGNKARIEFHKTNVYEEGEEQGELEKTFHIPATNHPDVLEAFNSIEYVPEGIKWLYSNIGTGVFDTFRGDFDRDIPGFEDTVNNYFIPASGEVTKGNTTIEAIAADVENQMNIQTKAQMEEFEKQRQEAYENFEELRKSIKEK